MFALTHAPLTPAELSDVPVPETAPWISRARQSRWQPIQHGELACALLDEAESLGLRVAQHRWETSGPGDTELFGSIDFSRSASLKVPRGMLFSVGVRHSNAGRYALTLVTGARVIVCTNGMLIGERVLCRRHTDDLDLRAAVRAGLEGAIDEAQLVNAWVGRLRRTSVIDAVADRVMMAGARAQVLSWSAIKQVDRAWRRPPQEAFEPRTAWSLYNAFTEVARTRSPEVQLRALRGLRELFSASSLTALQA